MYETCQAVRLSEYLRLSKCPIEPTLQLVCRTESSTHTMFLFQRVQNVSSLRIRRLPSSHYRAF